MVRMGLLKSFLWWWEGSNCLLGGQNTAQRSFINPVPQFPQMHHEVVSEITFLNSCEDKLNAQQGRGTLGRRGAPPIIIKNTIYCSGLTKGHCLFLISLESRYSSWVMKPIKNLFSCENYFKPLQGFPKLSEETANKSPRPPHRQWWNGVPTYIHITYSLSCTAQINTTL